MLGSAMSEAILEANCGGDYLTSRANWTIQSSGVDLLHACLVIQDYLFGGLELDAQFQFSYHDEYWNLAHAKDQLKAAWVMQVAHLWSWTYFFTRLGFKDIPYQYMFFSGVNIDTCFRKEVYQSQETPSSQLEVPPGQMFKPIHLSQLNQLL
jgi:DNA polymerase gamma 1